MTTVTALRGVGRVETGQVRAEVMFIEPQIESPFMFICSFYTSPSGRPSQSRLLSSRDATRSLGRAEEA